MKTPVEKAFDAAVASHDTPPSEESIERYHAKTPEELEQMVPGDPAVMIVLPDGREVTVEEYQAMHKTTDAKPSLLSRIKRRVRVIRTPGGDIWRM